MTYIEHIEDRIKHYKERLALAKKVLKDYSTGTYSQHQLAAKYGVPRATIANIIYDKY